MSYSVLDFSSDIQSFLANKRSDAALATVYAFMSLEEVPIEESMSLFIEADPINFAGQNFLMFAMMSNEGLYSKHYSMTSGLSDSIAMAIIQSMGSDVNIARLYWEAHSNRIYDKFLSYFKQYDYSIAYLYVQHGVYPESLSKSNWSNLFAGSKRSLNLVFGRSIKDNEARMSAIMRSNIDENGVMNGEYSVESVFRYTRSLFELIKVNPVLSDIAIADYDPSIIWNLTKDSDYSNTIPKWFVHFFLAAIIRVSKKTNSAKYLDLLNFLDHQSRYPSNEMVSIEMQRYRQSPESDVVPEELKSKNGLISKAWIGSSTSSWAVSSIIITELYRILAENPAPSLVEFDDGFLIAKNLLKSVLSVGSDRLFSGRIDSVNKLISALEYSQSAFSGNKFLNSIQSGNKRAGLNGFLSQTLSGEVKTDQIMNCVASSYDGMIELYTPKPGRVQDSLDYIGKNLGICSDLSNDESSFYTVFYKGFPFYVVEVDPSNHIIQFKGVSNRAIGSYAPAIPVLNRTKRSKTRSAGLFVFDIRNLLVILSMFSEWGISISPDLWLSDFQNVDDSDLYQEDGHLKKVSDDLSDWIVTAFS